MLAAVPDLISATTDCITALRSGSASYTGPARCPRRAQRAPRGMGCLADSPTPPRQSERRASSDISSAESSSIRRVQTYSRSLPSSKGWKWRSNDACALRIRASRGHLYGVVFRVLSLSAPGVGAAPVDSRAAEVFACLPGRATNRPSTCRYSYDFCSFGALKHGGD
jgi:hypothetical protein